MMLRNCYYLLLFTLILTLSLPISSADSQALEEKLATQQKEALAHKKTDEFPLRKPRKETIKEQWAFNSWIDEGFSKLSDKLSIIELRKLRSATLKKGGIFGATMRKGRTIKTLDSAISTLEAIDGKDNPYPWAFIETFLPLMKTIRQQVHYFLTIDIVYDGLQGYVKPDKMCANWFRYGHLFAYQPGNAGPLFTKEFRQRIYGNQFQEAVEEMNIEDIYEILYTLFKIYYHAGLKYTESDKETFEIVKKVYGPKIVEKDKQTRIFEEEGCALIWKLEDRAWRLDDFTYPTKPTETIDGLVSALRDRDVNVRKNAVAKLIMLGSKAQDALPALIQALQDEDLEIRCQAAQAIGNVGPRAEQAIQPLIQALKDNPEKYGRIREAATEALAKIGEASVSALIECLDDEDSRVVCAVAADVFAWKMSSKEAIPALMKTLKTRSPNSPEIRDCVVLALGNTGTKDVAVPLLLETLNEENMIVACASAEAILRTGIFSSHYPHETEIVPVLKKALDHKDKAVREIAADLVKRYRLELN